jgi:hypothetical protein
MRLGDSRIESASADPDHYTVTLLWQNGSLTTARLGHLVGHGVFEPLRDPEFFKKATPAREGRALAWPGREEDRIEFCADALWLEAHSKDAPSDLAPFFPERKMSKAVPGRPAPT